MIICKLQRINAKKVIDELTIQYSRARQATLHEITEIVAGAGA